MGNGPEEVAWPRLHHDTHTQTHTQTHTHTHRHTQTDMERKKREREEGKREEATEEVKVLKRQGLARGGDTGFEPIRVG